MTIPTNRENPDPSRVHCERCNGTGMFAGKECPQCRGSDDRLIIEGEKPKRRPDRQARSQPKSST